MNAFLTVQGTLLALQHSRHASIKFSRLHVPHVLRRDVDPTAEDFVGTQARNFPTRKFFFDINTALIYQSSHFSIHTLNLQNSLNLLVSLQTPKASLMRAFFFP